MKRTLIALVLLAAAADSLAANILVQDFEAGSPPLNWTRTQNMPSMGWEFGTALGSNYFAIPAHTRYAVSNDDAHDDNTTAANVANLDRLITPVMNLSSYAGQAILLNFKYVQPGNYGSTGAIQVSLNGGAWSNVKTVAPSATWTSGTALLSAYAGQSNVRIAFLHDDHGYWAEGFAIDDVLIETLPARDAVMLGLGLPTHIAMGSTVIKARVYNHGATPITSLGFSYKVNNGGTYNGTANNLAIAPGEEAVVSHPLAFGFQAPGNFPVELNVTSVNGSSDLNAANNLFAGTIKVLTQVPTKRVVLEQHTGAWCQFCPDGAVVAEQANAFDPDVITVSVHNGDGMTIPDGGVLQSEYISGYPGGTIDRTPLAGANQVDVSRSDWLDAVDQQLAEIVPASVTVTSLAYNAPTRTITSTVQTNFYGSESGDLRLNLWIVEDGVTGIGAGYNQVNYYNTVAGHPYFGSGNPIVGFTHNGVVRAMLGGAWGTANLIPANVLPGEAYAKTYQFVLPVEFSAERVRVVGVLQRYGGVNSEREIINAHERELMPTIFANGFD